jgi:predicted nucleic acid-binding protein
MLVVADSSPLSILVRSGYVSILPDLFGRVIIPPEVALELSHSHAPESVRAFIAKPPDWLEVRPATDVEQIPKLDAGEAAAINLARELHADLLLIDEIDGREIALQWNLSITGTLGVLERAAERGLVDLREAIDALRLGKFWLADELVKHALDRDAARRSTSNPPSQ